MPEKLNIDLLKEEDINSIIKTLKDIFGIHGIVVSIMSEDKSLNNIKSMYDMNNENNGFDLLFFIFSTYHR